MNDSNSPHPEQTADSAPLSGMEKATFSQSDTAAGAVAPDQSIPTAFATIDVGATLSGYKLIQKLGEGGMGAVFIAEDVALRRKVALKLMKPELAAKDSAKQRFFREARAAARIEHDNIVPIHQVGEDNGVPFLAMALLKGESLGASLKRNPRPETSFILSVGRDVADGLAAAHQEGLIHRDIKPDNIWIEPQPKSGGVRAKILDFGLARPQDEEQSLVTQEGAILGTPAYMAPEQARGIPVDARADLFSLGVVLYQMATGRRPFSGRDTMAVLTSLAIDTPADPLSLNPAIPPILSKLIMRLLEKDVTKRVQKATDVSDVLQRLQPKDTVVVVAAAPIVEANPWADIDTSSMTDVEPPPPPLAASRPHPVAPIPRDRTEVVSRDAARGGTRSGRSLIIGSTVALAGIIAAAILIFGGKKGGSPGDNSKQEARNDNADKKERPIGRPPEPIVAGKKGLHTLRFTGADKVTLPTLAKVGVIRGEPFTLEAFVTPALAEFKQRNHVIDTIGQVGLFGSANAWTFDLRNPQDGSKPQRVQGAPILQGREVHLAAVSDGKKIMLFVDGKKVGSQSIVDEQPTKIYTPLVIGNGFNGLIREVRVSKNARYDQDFTVESGLKPDAETLALYHCDEGQGDVLNDSSPNRHQGKIIGAKWVKVDGGSPDPDRHAAEYVLSIGGTVRVNGEAKEIKAKDELPKERFTLTSVYLGDNKNVTDAGLANFKDCKNLTYLSLSRTQTTDAGLVHFQDCKNLTHLNLGRTNVSDVGVAYFKDCKKLTYLNLPGTNVSDVGLASFKDCKELMILSVSGNPQIGDAGVAHFKDCKKLTLIGIGNTQVGNAGVAHFKDCKNLTQLHVASTKVTKEAAADFAKARPQCQIVLDGGTIEPTAVADPTEYVLSIGGKVRMTSEAKEIYLGGTQVDEAGLLYLRDCKGLTYLDVRKTKVSAKGIEEFRKAQPQCQIEWDGGTIEPKVAADPNRRAVEWVLSVGGLVNITVDARGQAVNALGELPQKPFQISIIDLSKVDPQLVTNEALENLKGITGLISLQLQYQKLITDDGMKQLASYPGLAGLLNLSLFDTAITDKGVAHLAQFRKLKDLDLSAPAVTDDALQHLSKLEELESLVITGTAVTGEGLKHLRELPALTRLTLNRTITDAGLKHLAGTKIRLLRLDYSYAVTNAGIAHLAGAAELTHLYIAGTKVGDEGLAHLKGLKHLETLTLDQTNATDAGLEHLRELARLKRLQLTLTKVTADGVKKLAVALPKCRIEWDGGAIGPKNPTPP